MARVGTGTIFLIAVLTIAVISKVCFSSIAAEAPPVKTIVVEEVKTEQEAGADRITSQQVEEARLVTAERIYGLLVLWAVILLVIVVLRLQIRDDEKLYKEGYYSQDLE